ncbi:MAG: methionyl-tRNA formyltransferase [Pseudomonadota bacterium]|nr:methionyl-tRNA formyltransferase [Pseudomonadota bacterium]
MPTPLRVVFAGTPAFAARHLTELLASEHEVIAIYTQPDRPAGRGKQLTASPVKAVAQEHAIPVFQPLSLQSLEEEAALQVLKPDVMVVVAYGLLLPRKILDVPAFGCINVHASLLPRWRGAAPIHRAIEAGDQETGITIMRMDEGLDTGAILKIAKTSISASHTTGTLTDELETLGAKLLISTLDSLPALLNEAVDQPDNGITYAHKISKAEAIIDWSQSTASITQKMRALSPVPGCFTLLGDQRIKLWEASAVPNNGGNDRVPGTIISLSKEGLIVTTGDGLVSITRLQLPNRKPLSIADIVNGNPAPFSPGDQFGNHLK